MLGSIGLEYYHNHKVMKEAQALFLPDTTPKEELVNYYTENHREIRPQFDELLKINEDVVGWISIDDTKINYPIVQGDDNFQYLTRNYKNEDSLAGSIFMDYRNDVNFGNMNMIVYGHNMKDGSMFKELHKFLEEDFFYAHPEIYVDTLYDRFQAEVFSAYYTTTDFNYIQTDFASLNEYGALLEKMKNESTFETDIEVDETDQIITLSTCDYTLDPQKGRLVVHAKLTKEN